VVVSQSPRAPAGGHAVRLQLTPPQGGRFNTFAVSPDGRTLAFGASVKGKSGLWLRPLDSMDALLLPGTEGAHSPFWAPDGRSIGYFASAKLWRISVVGAPPIAICDAADGRGGTWASDGTIIYAPVQSSLFVLPT